MSKQIRVGDYVVFSLPAPSGGVYYYTGTVLENRGKTFVIQTTEFEYEETIEESAIIRAPNLQVKPIKTLVEGDPDSASTYHTGYVTIGGQERQAQLVNPFGDFLVSIFVVPKQDVQARLISKFKENFADTVDELLDRLINPFNFYQVATIKNLDNWIYKDTKTGQQVKVKKKSDVPRSMQRKAEKVTFSFGMAIKVEVKWVIDFAHDRNLVYSSYEEVPETFRSRAVRKVWVPRVNARNVTKVFWQSDRLFDLGMAWPMGTSTKPIRIGDFIGGVPYKHSKGDKLAMFMKMTRDEILAWSSFYELPMASELGWEERAPGQYTVNPEKIRPFTRLPIGAYCGSNRPLVREDFFQDLGAEYRRLRTTLQQLISTTSDKKDPKIQMYQYMLDLAIHG